jgi:hypothetical protein
MAPPAQTRKKTPNEIRDARIKELEDAQKAEKDARRREHLQNLIDEARLNNKLNATLLLGKFQDFVMARALSWEQAALAIGSVYSKAAAKYNETVAKQAAQEALDNQILFSVLTVATSGALSWVTEFAAQSRDFVPDKKLEQAINGTAQAGVGEALSAVAPLVFPTNLDPVSVNPLTFQNNLFSRIDSVEQQVLMAFGTIKGNWAAAPLDAWDEYDNVEQLQEHASWKKEAVNLAGKEDLPDEGFMAEELERGMWARHILDSHHHRDFGVFETKESYEYVGDKIYRRLSELDITARAGLPPTPPQGPSTAGKLLGIDDDPQDWDYANALAAWAQGFQVANFVQFKRNRDQLVRQGVLK